MNNLSAMELITLMDNLEMVEPQREYSNAESIIDAIFFKAFGIDWDKNKIYKELRSNINNLMDLVEDQFTKGYYNLISK